MKTDADDQRAAEHGVHVGVEQRVGDVVADARPREDGLGQHRAFEQAGVGERDHRHQRHGGVAERVAARSRASRSPLTRAVTMYSCAAVRA